MVYKLFGLFFLFAGLSLSPTNDTYDLWLRLVVDTFLFCLRALLEYEGGVYGIFLGYFRCYGCLGYFLFAGSSLLSINDTYDLCPGGGFFFLLFRALLEFVGFSSVGFYFLGFSRALTGVWWFYFCGGGLCGSSTVSSSHGFAISSCRLLKMDFDFLFVACAGLS